MSAMCQVLDAHIDLAVDALDNVMAVLKAVKEVDELWIRLGAQSLVRKVGGHCEIISSDYPVNVPV